MDKQEIIKALRRLRRKIKRKARRMPKVLARLGKRAAKKSARKMKRRGRGLLRFGGRVLRSGPKRLTRRWFRRKTKKMRTRTYRPRVSTPDRPMQRRGGGRHDIVPGRSIVEWLPHPELGRGRVLAFLPGQALDVEFELGGRPPSGVRIEEVRVLSRT